MPHTVLPYNMHTRSPLNLFTSLFSPYLGGLNCSGWRHWAHLLPEFCLPAAGYAGDSWCVHSCSVPLHRCLCMGGTGASVQVLPCAFPHVLPGSSQSRQQLSMGFSAGLSRSLQHLSSVCICLPSNLSPLGPAGRTLPFQQPKLIILWFSPFWPQNKSVCLYKLSLIPGSLSQSSWNVWGFRWVGFAQEESSGLPGRFWAPEVECEPSCQAGVQTWGSGTAVCTK